MQVRPGYRYIVFIHNIQHCIIMWFWISIQKVPAVSELMIINIIPVALGGVVVMGVGVGVGVIRVGLK